MTSTPATGSLRELQKEAATCTACPLYAAATQTVFGEGPADADLVLVGEAPGDREDREGHPFVGPAGLLLRRVMEEVGLPPERSYLTNAVKHFKFTQRGKRRIHQKPGREEVIACHPWLDAELSTLRPKVVVALGATAAHALVGRSVVISTARGALRAWDGPGQLLVTVHPSAVLRSDEEARAGARQAFKDDLALAAAALR
jgi:uracil-DNA glycosylase family protein